LTAATLLKSSSDMKATRNAATSSRKVGIVVAEQFLDLEDVDAGIKQQCRGGSA